MQIMTNFKTESAKVNIVPKIWTEEETLVTVIPAVPFKSFEIHTRHTLLALFHSALVVAHCLEFTHALHILLIGLNHMFGPAQKRNSNDNLKFKHYTLTQIINNIKMMTFVFFITRSIEGHSKNCGQHQTMRCIVHYIEQCKRWPSLNSNAVFFQSMSTHDWFETKFELDHFLLTIQQMFHRFFSICVCFSSSSNDLSLKLISCHFSNSVIPNLFSNGNEL